jgi:hypothetical protein
MTLLPWEIGSVVLQLGSEAATHRLDFSTASSLQISPAATAKGLEENA